MALEEGLMQWSEARLYILKMQIEMIWIVQGDSVNSDIHVNL